MQNLIIKKFKRYLGHLINVPVVINTDLRDLSTLKNLADLRDLILETQTRLIQERHINPLNQFGKKCFSQTDEDGITLEILRRINCLDDGVFAEFGVGNGMENNTLILKALGWKGFWVGGEDLAFKTGTNDKKFFYSKSWITAENVVAIAQGAIKQINAETLDVISLDLDGNDIYFTEKLLTGGFLPKLFIIEYNAKFPPPVKWQMPYNPDHQWQGDDYFGASLCSFVELFKAFDYSLVCCNSHSGANAFFVQNKLNCHFTDIPNELNKIHASPRYYLYQSFGHKQSIHTIASLFK